MGFSRAGGVVAHCIGQCSPPAPPTPLRLPRSLSCSSTALCPLAWGRVLLCVWIFPSTHPLFHSSSACSLPHPGERLGAGPPGLGGAPCHPLLSLSPRF